MYVKMYLFTRLSVLTKTTQWVFSTKKQIPVKFGSTEISGFSSSHYVPGQKATSTVSIDTVFTNIDKDSEQDKEIIQPMFTKNNGSDEFVVKLDSTTYQAEEILTMKEYEEIATVPEDSDTEELEQEQASV